MYGPSGEGPYRGRWRGCERRRRFSQFFGEIHASQGFSWDGLRTRPTPIFDNFEGEIKGFFGFLDLQSYQNWFTPADQEALFSHGFGLWAVSAEEIHGIGDSGQVCFAGILNHKLIDGVEDGYISCDGTCLVCKYSKQEICQTIIDF